MTPIQTRKPIVLSNIQALDKEYRILIRRRKHLQEEMGGAAPPLPLQRVRRAELAYIESYVRKIENFLHRYGFIDKNGAHHDRH